MLGCWCQCDDDVFRSIIEEMFPTNFFLSFLIINFFSSFQLSPKCNLNQ